MATTLLPARQRYVSLVALARLFACADHPVTPSPTSKRSPNDRTIPSLSQELSGYDRRRFRRCPRARHAARSDRPADNRHGTFRPIITWLVWRIAPDRRWPLEHRLRRRRTG